MSLRFMHIPKTAGSTFGGILQRQYRGKGYFSFSGDIGSDTERFKGLSERARQAVELFTGHASLSTGIAEADRAVIITFLRDPIKRVKSFCQHVSEGKSPHLRKEFPPETFRLDAFLDGESAELSNLQTKMLINSGECDSPILLDTLSSSAARDLALANLCGKVASFGLTEFFDESLMVFGRALHWSMPFYARVNARDASRLIEFQKRHLDRIAELNSIDIEVYGAARASFLDILESMEYDKARLRLFRSVNAFASTGMAIRSRVGKSLSAVARRGRPHAQ